jgi:hypothetical protein
VSIRPVGLRQEIVDDIDPALAKQFESVFEVDEFAWPRVRENEIEVPAFE